MQDIISSVSRKASLDALTAIGGVWDAAALTIDLLTDAIGSVSPVTTVAQAVAATPDNVAFPGYTQFAMDPWGGDYQDGSDNWFRNAIIHQWITTAVPPEPLNIVGYYYTDGTQLRIVLFDNPIVVSKAGQAVTCTPFFGYGQ